MRKRIHRPFPPTGGRLDPSGGDWPHGNRPSGERYGPDGASITEAGSKFSPSAVKPGECPTEDSKHLVHGIQN